MKSSINPHCMISTLHRDMKDSILVFFLFLYNNLIILLWDDLYVKSFLPKSNNILFLFFLGGSVVKKIHVVKNIFQTSCCQKILRTQKTCCFFSVRCVFFFSPKINLFENQNNWKKEQKKTTYHANVFSMQDFTLLSIFFGKRNIVSEDFYFFKINLF
jgi:hypothetical protein